MFYNILSIITNKGSFTRFASGLLAAAVFLISLSACSASSSTNSDDASVKKITVSIPPLQYFAKAIAGDSLEIISLLDETADPETFQPGVSSMRTIAGSEIFVTTGLMPFENSLLKNISKNNPDLKLHSVAEGIDLIYGTHSHNGHEHSGEPDPHIWSSITNARIIAANMLAALIDADPEHTAYFTGRYNDLISHLDSLDSSVKESLSTLPSPNFAVWHPFLSYFSRDYNLHQIPFNIENKETSSIRLRAQIDKAAAARPAAFIVTSGVNPSQTEAISEAIGLSPVTVNPMSANWENEMINIVNAFNQPTCQKN